MLYKFIAAFFLAFLLSVIFTPIARKIALFLKIVDNPNERKVHRDAMPYLGGVAIFLAFVCVYTYYVIFTEEVATYIGYALVFGGFVIVTTGVLDDKFNLKPRYKLLGQFLASLIAIYFGLKIQVVTIPLTDYTIDLGYLGIPITIFWILAISNAMNLIDGLDGLAAGVSGIAFLSFSIVSFLIGNYSLALLCLTLVGSIFGFLLFNFHPAKIFMGDAGSMFLGYAIAVASLLELKEATFYSLLVPLLVLGVPIADTFFAIIRRRMNHQPISSPDKNHFHHKLLSFGFSHRQTVLLIYLISFIFSSFAVILTINENFSIRFLIVVVFLVIVEIIAEMVGLFQIKNPPMLTLFRKFGKIKKKMLKRNEPS